MIDSDRFAALLNAEYPCLCINTTEEEEARKLVATAFLDRGKPVSLWTASDGIRDGLLEGSPANADTVHPAAACAFLRLKNWIPGEGAILLDVASQLTD